MMGRRPDFIVIGAMKAGTTTLFQWLDGHPGCQLSPVKEPHFFSRDANFSEGVDSYLDLFSRIPTQLLTGEASASYADPRIAGVVAERMGTVAPEAKLVYLVRDPVARMKSHFLHEWQRSREQRGFLEAIEDPDNPYVAMSRYADTAHEFLTRFPRQQLLIVRTEDLAAPTGPGWQQVTRYLGLHDHEGRADRANVSETKVAFNPLLLRLWEAGWLDRARHLPGPVRRVARRATGRSTGKLERQRAMVKAHEVPRTVTELLQAQYREVQALGDAS